MAFPSDLALKGIYLLGQSDFETIRYRKGISHDGIDVKVIEYIPDDRVPLWDNEFEQGSIGTQSLIFEVTGDNDQKVYLRKDGAVSSYGRESWDGPLYEVRAVQRTVNVYEKV